MLSISRAASCNHRCSIFRARCRVCLCVKVSAAIHQGTPAYTLDLEMSEMTEIMADRLPDPNAREVWMKRYRALRRAMIHAGDDSEQKMQKPDADAVLPWAKIRRDLPTSLLHCRRMSGSISMEPLSGLMAKEVPRKRASVRKPASAGCEYWPCRRLSAAGAAPGRHGCFSAHRVMMNRGAGLPRHGICTGRVSKIACILE